MSSRKGGAPAAIPTTELLDVSGYEREVLADTARQLRVIVDGWPATRRNLPRYRWMVAMLAHLDAAVAQDAD